MSATLHKQVLLSARTLIADRAHWTHGTLASTADDKRVGWEEASASKWCALGAIYRAAYNLVGNTTEATRIGKEVVKEICPPDASFSWFVHGYLPSVNDLRGHHAVLSVFDKALVGDCRPRR